MEVDRSDISEVGIDRRGAAVLESICYYTHKMAYILF